MSFNKILTSKSISSNAKVLIMIFLESNNDLKVEASIDEISCVSNIGRSVTVKALKELEANNYISKVRRGQGKNNLYIINKEVLECL